MCAPSEKFLMMGGPLAMGLGVVFVANIGTFFLPPGSALGASLASIAVYCGLILLSAFLLHDTQRLTQRLVKKAEMKWRSDIEKHRADRSILGLSFEK
uniref:Uncharacterized protein n=1 Tax=Panagrolaimus sp. PS1159 TaxID=55785 RepID=A0AC35F871_9BILA